MPCPDVLPRTLPLFGRCPTGARWQVTIEAFPLPLMLIIVGSRRDLGQPSAALFSIPLPCLFLPVPGSQRHPQGGVERAPERCWPGAFARVHATLQTKADTARAGIDHDPRPLRCRWNDWWALQDLNL